MVGDIDVACVALQYKTADWRTFNGHLCKAPGIKRDVRRYFLSPAVSGLHLSIRLEHEATSALTHTTTLIYVGLCNLLFPHAILIWGMGIW